MSPYIELAQKRLKEFMAANNAKPAEMDKVFRLSKGTVRDVLRNKGISGSLHGENIMRELGADGHALDKLNAVRGNQKHAETPKRPDAFLPTAPGNVAAHKAADANPGTGKESARDKVAMVSRLKKFKTDHALSWADVTECLNAAGVREFKQNAISVAIAPSNKMPQATVDVYSRAIEYAETHFDDFSPLETNPAETKAPEPKQANDGVRKSPTEYLDESPEETEPGEKSAGGGAEIDPAVEEELSADDSESEANAYAPTVADLADACSKIMASDFYARHMGRKLVEDAFGMGFDELIELKPQIEMMVVCKRNSIGCRVVPDSVQVL